MQVIYVTSITPSGNVFQVANFIWSRLFTDELSTQLGWALKEDDDDEEEDENAPKKTRRSGHKGQQKLYTALRSFARDVTFLIYAVARRRCTLGGRRMPSTFLIVEAVREARKQAVTRFNRNSTPILEERFYDLTSPSGAYLTAGDMEDDLAIHPQALFDYHVCDESNYSN
jgi:hypothetical protein